MKQGSFRLFLLLWIATLFNLSEIASADCVDKFDYCYILGKGVWCSKPEGLTHCAKYCQRCGNDRSKQVFSPAPEETTGRGQTDSDDDFDEENKNWYFDENKKETDFNDFDFFFEPRELSTVGWSRWAHWSTCSVTCGTGKRTRTRECKSGICPGNKIQTSECILLPNCVTTQPWTRRCKDRRSDCTQEMCSTGKRNDCKNTCKLCFKWGGYGRLDKCGDYGGVCERRRFRHCLLGICLGLPFQSRKCDERFCVALKPWKQWSAWADCSASCGDAEKTRTRQCDWTNCNEIQTDRVKCEFKSCVDPNVPNIVYVYGECSETCGTGQQEGKCTTEYCKLHDVKSMIRPCKLKDCLACVENRPAYCERYKSFCRKSRWMKLNCKVTCNLCTPSGWTQWGAWGACSHACGGGINNIRLRHRTCVGSVPCVGESTQKDICVKGECPVWGKWGNWSPCSETCGNEGFYDRKRTCVVGKCVGETTQKKDCTETLPPCENLPVWSEWGQWSDCTKSCLKGMRSRTRKCNRRALCGNAPSTDREVCNDHKCFDKTTQCNLNCGGGYRWAYQQSCTRNNMYECDGYFQGCNYQPCSIAPCPIQLNLKRRYGSTTCCNSAKIEMNCGRVLARETPPVSAVPKSMQHVASADQRIINAMVSEKQAWPWMVMFMPSVTQGIYCGGTLIHKNWVLTAGHCVVVTATKAKRPRSGMAVYLGINNMIDMRKQNSRRVRQYFTHPDFEFPFHDIALLRIDDVVPSKGVYPACLPKGENVGTNQKCYVTGWGVFDLRNPSSAPNLMEVGLRVLDENVCKRVYKAGRTGEYIQKYSHQVVCAGSVYERNDTCSGDSGGPLVCQRCSSCSWYVAGVTSFGPRDCGSPGQPGVYTKVVEHEDWIYKYIPELRPKSGGR